MVSQRRCRLRLLPSEQPGCNISPVHSRHQALNVSQGSADVVGRPVEFGKKKVSWSHGEVKKLWMNRISSTPQCPNQQGAAMKLVTEGANDENGCV